MPNSSGGSIQQLILEKQQNNVPVSVTEMLRRRQENRGKP